MYKEWLDDSLHQTSDDQLVFLKATVYIKLQFYCVSVLSEMKYDLSFLIKIAIIIEFLFLNPECVMVKKRP